MFHSDEDSGLGSTEAQLVTKEMEWKAFLATRVHQLESFLKKAQEECSSLRERYQQLREDFQFNLAILDDRDRELERYVISARALTVKHNRQEELNLLHMQVTRLEEQIARETERRQEDLSKNQSNAAQHKLQLDELKRSMADEIKTQTEEYDRMKWNLQFRIQEMEQELSLQRQVKLLSNETKVHCQAHLQTIEALKASKKLCQQIQTQLQHKEEEVKDLTAVKDYRIKELEGELKQMETKLKESEDNPIKKYEDVIQALKKCDSQLEAQFQAHTEQLQKTEKHLVKLQKKMKILAQAQEDQQKAMKQKDETIQRLCREVEKTRTGWGKYITKVSSEMVVKDTEIITLQEKVTKHRTERDRSREEIEWYKQQLSDGLKREKGLEQMRVQVELEWQNRCEDMKAEHCLANEQLLHDLTKTREQVDSMASEEISRLQKQNNILRDVVTQMRKDMEGLSHPLPQPQAQPQASSPQPVQCQEAPAQMVTGPPPQSTDISTNVSSADYTQALEQEDANSILKEKVSLLKARCRELEGQLEGAVGLPSQVSATDKTKEGLARTVLCNTHLQNQGLKQGGVCLEKHANTSALTKQEIRVTHILDQLQEENPHLWQQQASGLMSGGLFVNVQGARSNPPLLHTRLKQAAFCIARLSTEKQQLIEMCNRLRGQINTARYKERHSCTEILEEQHDRLNALEQLQYQLTTQELQYALRQSACTFAEQLLPGTNNQGPATKGASNRWSQWHKTTDRTESSKNKDNGPLSQSQSSPNVGPQPHSGLSRSRLSSEESLRSLNMLWEILDHGLSLSMFSEGEGELSREEVAESSGAGVQMMVHGISVPIHSQPPTEIQQKRNPSTTPSNPTKTCRSQAPNRISKIRNYNVKD